MVDYLLEQSEHTPYIWADNVLGKPEVYNEVHLINKETLETDRIIKVGKEKGQLIDAKTGKFFKSGMLLNMRR